MDSPKDPNPNDTTSVDTTFVPPSLTISATWANQPTVTNDGITVDLDYDLTFFIEATADATSGADLKSFDLLLSGVNAITDLPPSQSGYDFDTPANLAGGDARAYRDTLVITDDLLTQEGGTNFRFVITDAKGMSKEQIIVVTTIDTTFTPLGKNFTGEFYHRSGIREGSYDLVNNQLLSAASADFEKDMSNTDNTGQPFTGSWEALNATRFVRDNNFDFANASEEAAVSSYSSQVSSNGIADPIVNEIYIAKLRGNNQYAVIKITGLDPNDPAGGGNNPGKITFDYKKR